MCLLRIEDDKDNLVPFRLRDHLVSFLFKEFKAEESVYMPHLQTKAIKLNRRSSLCRIITLVHSKYENSQNPYDYKLQFSIRQVPGGKKCDSALYKSYRDVYEKLSFSNSDNFFINGFFEDIFRTAFLFYVLGGKKFSDNDVKGVIDDFMDEYDLLEFGYDPENLRVLFYRETGKDSKLSRFQHKITNRVKNYDPLF